MIANMVPTVCAALLAALICALIFSSSFRADMLKGKGEASVLGVLSVSGAAIVLLAGLLLAGLLVSAKTVAETQPKSAPPIYNYAFYPRFSQDSGVNPLKLKYALSLKRKGEAEAQEIQYIPKRGPNGAKIVVDSLMQGDEFLIVARDSATGREWASDAVEIPEQLLEMRRKP